MAHLKTDKCNFYALLYSESLSNQLQNSMSVLRKFKEKSLEKNISTSKCNNEYLSVIYKML